MTIELKSLIFSVSMGPKYIYQLHIFRLTKRFLGVQGLGFIDIFSYSGIVTNSDALILIILCEVDSVDMFKM